MEGETEKKERERNHSLAAEPFSFFFGLLEVGERDSSSLPPFITPLPPSLPVTLQIFPSQEGGGGH